MDKFLQPVAIATFHHDRSGSASWRCPSWSWRNLLQDRSQVLPAPAFQDTGLMDEVSIHPSQDSVSSTIF